MKTSALWTLVFCVYKECFLESFLTKSRIFCDFICICQKNAVTLQRFKKTRTMETKNFKLDAAAFFKKMQADKQALNACIREGGNVSAEAQKRGLTLATPI